MCVTARLIFIKTQKPIRPPLQSQPKREICADQTMGERRHRLLFLIYARHVRSNPVPGGRDSVAHKTFASLSQCRCGIFLWGGSWFDSSAQFVIRIRAEHCMPFFSGSCRPTHWASERPATRPVDPCLSVPHSRTYIFHPMDSLNIRACAHARAKHDSVGKRSRGHFQRVRTGER